MAKNTTKPADHEGMAPGDTTGPQATSEDGTSGYSDAPEGGDSGNPASGFQATLEASGNPGLILHPSFAESSSKQIAARGAIRTAHYCVFGEALPEAVAVGWSEGGVVLPYPETVAAMMKRVCETLGVLTEVVSP